jgi:integrase/recombinase XerD
MNRGYDALKVMRKGGKKGSLAIRPQAAQRIRDYLELAGHGDDIEGPLFRPVKDNHKAQESCRHLAPIAIDRVLRKYARSIGLDRGFSAHSMRATFITTALDNGASLEDVQSAAGHADPSTTKLYDRRGYNPEKSASFFAIERAREKIIRRVERLCARMRPSGGMSTHSVHGQKNMHTAPAHPPPSALCRW